MKGIWPSHHDPTQENLGQKLLDYNACSWRTRQQPEQQRGQDEKKRRPHPSSIILPPHVVCGSFAGQSMTSYSVPYRWKLSMLLRAYAETSPEKVRQSAAESSNKFVVTKYMALIMSLEVVLQWKSKLDWCSHIERRIPICNKRVQNLAWLIKEKISGLPPRK